MLYQSTLDQSNGFLAATIAGGTRGRRTKKWQCTLSEVLVGDYLVIPLTSAKMLTSEGYRMNNCCRQYVDQCAAASYAVFSVRSRSGERIATLGLKRERGHWYFDQCVGPSNTNVLEETMEYLDEEGMPQSEWFPTEIYYVVHEVARLMNIRSSEQTPEYQ